MSGRYFSSYDGKTVMADVDVNGNSLELTIEDEKVKAIGNIPVGGGDESVWTDETFNALGDDNGENILDENDEAIGDEDAETLWATRDGVGFKAERAEADINGNSLELHVNAEGKIDKIGNKYIEGTGEAPVDAYSKEETNALLDDKVDKVSGKGLSANDYTNADKGKLDNIESGAEVNLIESVKVDGSALTIDANKAVDIPLASATSSGNETVYVTGVVTGQDKQKWDSWASAVFTIIPIPNTVVIGDRTYPTVTIGNQVWMTENLDFQWNGLSVGEAGTSSEESRANYYNNEASVYGVSGNKYGLLYNWTALEYLNSNREELLPGGWRIPTWSDFQTLANSLGDDPGVKMKSTTGWVSGGNGTNASGFNAFPSGYYTGSFIESGNKCLVWTSSPSLSSGLITVMSLKFNDNRMNSYSNYKYWQHSIRLVKDAT